MPPKSTPKEGKSQGMVHAFAFLERTEKSELPCVVACFGRDEFLRQRSMQHAVKLGGLDESTIRSFDGDEAAWRDVHDELATRSLFDLDGRRAVKLRAADKFVTKHRDILERWIDKSPVGATLLLDVQTLAANTNLYKLIVKQGWLVSAGDSKGVESAKFVDWILHWGQTQHALFLTRPQAFLIADRVGQVCGLIDCELAKLALFANAQGIVDDARVHELVGGWRTQTVWDLADWVGEGKIEPALEAIDKLVMAGQSIVGIAAQLSWSLRRYGTAAHLIEQMERNKQRPVLQLALERAGFRPFETGKAETRLKRIGRPRAKELLSWLLELEIQLKGSHSNDDRARMALEAFLLRLSDLKPSSVRNAS